MSGRFTAGVFIVVVSVVAVALVWTGVRDYESFTPPVATAVDRADCLAPDITAALVAPRHATAASHFAPREVVTRLLISAPLPLFDANAEKRPTVG